MGVRTTTRCTAVWETTASTAAPAARTISSATTHPPTRSSQISRRDTATGEGSDSFSLIDGVVGSAYGDTLTAAGFAAAISLIGLDGTDALTGGSGNDAIQGGNGNDTLSGGNGDDWLYPGSGIDQVDGGGGGSTWRGTTTHPPGSRRA